MTPRRPTPSQTVGPFFHPAMLRDDARRQELVGKPPMSQPIRIEGRVLDGEGAPVPDALIEIWQADARGRYDHPADRRDHPPASFLGYGRAGTDDEGRYRFETMKPGSVPFDETRSQAPHVCVTIFARGLLNHLVTRIYFADEPANADDPILLCVPPERRATLTAEREPGEADAYRIAYRFDIVLRGEGETAFFNV